MIGGCPAASAAGRPVPPRDIGHRSSQHQALRRNPRPLRFRASLTPGRPLDHFQPRNPIIRKAVQMAAHFAVSFQANTSDVHAHGDWPVQITSGRRGSASRLRSVRNGARSLLAQRKARPIPAGRPPPMLPGGAPQSRRLIGDAANPRHQGCYRDLSTVHCGGGRCPLLKSVTEWRLFMNEGSTVDVLRQIQATFCGKTFVIGRNPHHSTNC